jgi:hypothetical protein
MNFLKRRRWRDSNQIRILPGSSKSYTDYTTNDNYFFPYDKQVVYFQLIEES